MGYSRVDCRAVCLLFWHSFLSLPCGGLCYGTDNQRHENHLYVDCPGVGQVARGLRTLSYKPDAEGMITKTKARLVAKGFMQGEGVDYLQTSAPTPAAASVKILMTVANEKCYKIYHLGVAQAFTKAELDCGIHEASGWLR